MHAMALYDGVIIAATTYAQAEIFLPTVDVGKQDCTQSRHGLCTPPEPISACLAHTNKCLVRSNKSPHRANATIRYGGQGPSRN